MPTSLNPTAAISVFFDNDCAICRREVAFCKTLDKDQRIDWIDLRSQRQLAADMGVDFEAAMELLHVLDADGNMHIGLAGHLVMWSYLPGYRHLSRLLRQHPRLAALCDRYYRLFTRLRPGARKRTACATSLCEGGCNE
jgi:predicted DCC family thiol-disulfide oxidoreductase YuxK